MGNADFETNYDVLEIMSQTIYPKVRGNSIPSEIEKYSKLKQIDFIKEASDSLTDWITLMRDRAISGALCTDFTNGVVCDAINGYKDSSAHATMEAATREIQAGDVMNVKAIQRAIFMARIGLDYQNKKSFPIRPVRSDLVTEGGISTQHTGYIILLNSYAVAQLRRDPEWIEMQKFAGVRGEANKLFTGLAGMIDNCPVIDMGVWGEAQAGMPDSEVSDEAYLNAIAKENFKRLTPPSTYANTQPVCMGALIGASALVFVGAEHADFWIHEKDQGRKTVVGVDRLIAVSKARFDSFDSGKYNPYHDKDLAVIGLFCSKE